MLIIIHCAILLKLVPNEQVLCLLVLLVQYYDIILFQISGNVPVSMKFLKIIDRVLTTDLLHNLIIRIDSIIVSIHPVHVL